MHFEQRIRRSRTVWAHRMRARRSLFFIVFGVAFLGWSIQAVREQRSGGVPWKTGVGAAILLSAAVGAWFAFRSGDAPRQSRTKPGERGSAQTPPPEHAGATNPTDRVLENGVCAVCGRQLGAGERFCAFDGAEGVQSPPSHNAAICPRCGRGYIDGRTECVEDGSELVPVTGRARPSSTNRSPKVCPTCGKRRVRGSYCPHDGDRLVALN